MPAKDPADASSSSIGGLRPAVIEAKQLLGETREEIRALHHQGLEAIEVCARLTSSVDVVIQTLWRAALEDFDPSEATALAAGCVLVAHGGYGRRRLAPHSDVDLMVLYEPAIAPLAKRLAVRLTQDIFDVGLDLGHSLRTEEQAIQMSKDEVVIATSLLESRYVIGSPTLFERFFTAYRTTQRKRVTTASVQFAKARLEERDKYGETVYLLEPNIKRSRGGLRDLHLLRWLWFLQAGVSDLDRLQSLGVTSKFDHYRLSSARDFLLRVRNELHFGSTKAGDVLHRAEQLRIAEKFGYRDTEGLKPVEHFMRDYFRYAGYVWFITSRLTELTSPQPTVARVFGPMLTKSIERDYRVSFHEINATEQGLSKLTKNLSEVLRLVELARSHRRRIGQETWYEIYRFAHDYDSTLSDDCIEIFLEMLANPDQLGKCLRRLHDLCVLEKVIPPMAHARCLLQFNQYHKYTVDEHSLLAVELATEFADRKDLLGETYRGIKEKRTLHLALLIHDLGKGKGGDHSVIGETIANETAARLHLPEEEGKRMALLVRRHLDMSHLAFRRDTNDPEVVDQFAQLVESPETLAMLYVLTCADMAAVGPDVLNDWKIGVLGHLYTRALERLEDTDRDETDRRHKIHQEVWQHLNPEQQKSAWFARQFHALPESFIASRSAKSLAGALRRLQRIDLGGGDKGSLAWGGYIDGGAALEMVAVVARGGGQGVFSRMAGALSSKGLRIFSAETTLLEGGLLLIRYTAEDDRLSATSNAAEANRRIDSIASAMVTSVDSNEPPKFPKVWGADRTAADAALTAQPNEVRIDTTISEDCAIVEVFTIDRVGLLYELARVLYKLDLVIRFAKIATSLDRVVDVFYVTEQDETQPNGPERLHEISERLIAVIDDRENDE